jgi:hypothetical protein
MLYKINPIFTNNNFSTNRNEKISSNDQYYTAQLYMNFIEKDYEHCYKNISCDDKNYRRKLQCYNTWYTHCMVFVRDSETCKIYQNSEHEYLYYLWLKNKTTTLPCKDLKKDSYWPHGIADASKLFSAAFVENMQRFFFFIIL